MYPPKAAFSNTQKESTALPTFGFNFHLPESPANGELRILGTLHILLLRFTDFFLKVCSRMLLPKADIFCQGFLEGICSLFFYRKLFSPLPL